MYMYINCMYRRICNVRTCLPCCLNMVGRVPLIPLLLASNSSPTIPHQFIQHKRSCFQVGSCCNAAAYGQRGSYVYEVNQ